MEFPSIPTALLRPLLSSVISVNPSNDPADDPSFFQIISTPDKGKGVIASTSLARGTLLLSELPLAIWPSTLTPSQAQQLFSELSSTQQTKFMSLCPTSSANDLNEILSRRAANGFSIILPHGEEEDGETVSFIFERVSNFNHSCTPNVSQAMNFATLQMELYVIDFVIDSGTELTIEYIPSLTTLSRQARQKLLFASFGFEKCYCHVCTLPEDEGSKSDARREEIGQLVEALRSQVSGGKSGMMERLQRIYDLLQEEQYIGLPEFNDSKISYLYARFVGMKSQQDST